MPFCSKCNVVFVAFQLFFSFFKTLVGKEVIVELKNDLQIRGILQSVDQFLNFKLEETSVVDKEKFPQLVSSFVGPSPLVTFLTPCTACSPLFAPASSVAPL